MCRSILLSSILLLAACGCSSTEEQPQAIPLDHVPSTVPSPSAAEVSLLPGYHAQVVVSLLNYPSSISFDPMGNLYVAESGAAPGDESRPPRILRIAPGGQIDIMSDKVQTPVKEIQWHDGRLFIWHGEKISTVDHEGQLRDASIESAPPAGSQEQITGSSLQPKITAGKSCESIPNPEAAASFSAPDRKRKIPRSAQAQARAAR